MGETKIQAESEKVTFFKNTMQAVVCHGPKDYRLQKIRRPIAGYKELVIKIAACGICASDCKCHSGAAMFWGGEGQPSWVKPPVVPGHEFFGYVVAAGEGGEEHFGVRIGDRIIAEQIVPCEKCRYCKSGKYWMCEVHNIFGFQRDVADGGMADYMRIPPTAIVHQIPDSLSLEDAALIEPMACAIHTINRADIQFDDVVVIAGAGPLGLMMVQVARLKTPKKLVVIDLVPERLNAALQMGADMVINPSDDDAKVIIDSLTDSYGCDVYIETTGVPAGVTQGLELIRKLGRFVEFSVFGKETSADWSIIGDRKELDIRGAHLGPYCYPVAIDLFDRGLVTSEGIVTHTFSLDEWEKAFALANSLDSIKVLLKPTST
ncbi:alcohol dehydrogenase catalytic domain-containing protein [Glaciimonas sp. Gout2]|uniref:alcohol dehydrogenase catalytic domain-containing protein n=2 Tax=Glaciimonas TaxID=1229970 RepID=UPI002AB4A5ED|nr:MULTISPECIES: alcohol dehydrogenase catalytic domain-containing protein [unclassified Glaciimonas]MDY7548867.1 alcohol dehydrogenase catalytic domain-containing protein [Glaciimonas sp. CA11.2]MEB0012513.1 alcohol dehydrogenase catalytic domain-containing protein [Glaciimonas sp. Cout2]MEB0082558.1 alcohol dehydrogenase catalytic domain-containing protein [Glaciimonas sp. Gout2]